MRQQVRNRQMLHLSPRDSFRGRFDTRPAFSSGARYHLFMVSHIHSTCCSMATTIFASTDGLKCLVIIKTFGNFFAANPKYVLGPLTHSFATITRSRTQISVATSGPVTASKPVADTTTLNSCEPEEVLIDSISDKIYYWHISLIYWQ